MSVNYNIEPFIPEGSHTVFFRVKEYVGPVVDGNRAYRWLPQIFRKLANAAKYVEILEDDKAYQDMIE